MLDDLKSAISASLPEDGQAESSTATVQADPAVPAEAPAQQAEQEKEVPFHEHPRWKEIQQEKEAARQQADHWRQQAERMAALAQGLQQPAAPAQVDQFAGMTPEEKIFWQKVDERAEQKAKAIAESMVPQFQNQLKETREVVTTMIYQKFLDKYPDVKPGSQEEGQIAELFSKGYSLDDAYKVTFFEKQRQKEALQTKQQAQQKIQQKSAANLETSTSNPSSIPQKQKLSVREFALRKAQELGL
jgi:hypothetical protein